MGEFVDCLSGDKGLRQGDSLSQYLSVIEMEVFYCCLKEKAQDNEFKLHWRRENNAIVNPWFAGWPIIFCKEENISIISDNEALLEFQNLFDNYVFSRP